MRNELKSKMAVNFILLLLIFVGCSNNEYDTFTNNFYKIYFQIVESVDIRNTYDSLKGLQMENNKNDLDELKELLNDINSKVPKNKREHHIQLSSWYDGLVFLKNSYERWDSLSNEEKERIDKEMGLINIRKENYKKK